MRREPAVSLPSGARRAGPLTAFLALGLAGVACAGCSPRSPSPAPESATASRGAAESPELERLRGRWERTDGGYVLEVRAVSAGGQVEAVYLNPRPIHVAQAEATRAAGLLSLFVELQDLNYPGSSYNLAYDPARDVLEGTYYQAVQRQTFDVSFERR